MIDVVNYNFVNVTSSFTGGGYATFFTSNLQDLGPQSFSVNARLVLFPSVTPLIFPLNVLIVMPSTVSIP